MIDIRPKDCVLKLTGIYPSHVPQKPLWNPYQNEKVAKLQIYNVQSSNQLLHENIIRYIKLLLEIFYFQVLIWLWDHHRESVRLSKDPWHLVEACILASSLPRQHHLCWKTDTPKLWDTTNIEFNRCQLYVLISIRQDTWIIITFSS